MANIRVLVKEPGKPAEVKLIENDCRTFKSLIGGGSLGSATIGAGIMMYCDDEGKMKGLPYNFTLGALDFAVGNVVFFSNDGGEEEQSLSNQQIDFLQSALAVSYVPIVRVCKNTVIII